MRQRFEQQLSLDALPISDVTIALKSRDEMPPVVRALQYIFTTESLNEKIFTLLESKVCGGKKKTGRRGMDLWHILVLAVVRHATAANWDRLLMMANYDMLVRDILGIGSTGFARGGKEFEYQNLLDNVSLIDEGLLHQINDIVVEAGHQLVKKKDHEPLELALKTDSYAVETNIHFPTDLNLLWDSCRKCLDTVKHLQDIASIFSSLAGSAYSFVCWLRPRRINQPCILQVPTNSSYPKRGLMLTQKGLGYEDPTETKTLRNRHSAVESNVNMLEHHGLNRCMDKGLHGFKRCVGLSVLAYNLHILGNALAQAERKQQKQNEQRQQRPAA